MLRECQITVKKKCCSKLETYKYYCQMNITALIQQLCYSSPNVANIFHFSFVFSCFFFLVSFFNLISLTNQNCEFITLDAHGVHYSFANKRSNLKIYRINMIWWHEKQLLRVKFVCNCFNFIHFFVRFSSE